MAQNTNGKKLEWEKFSHPKDSIRFQCIELLYDNKIDSLIKFCKKNLEQKKGSNRENYFGLLMAYSKIKKWDLIRYYVSKVVEHTNWGETFEKVYPIDLATDYFSFYPIIEDTKYINIVNKYIENYYLKLKVKNKTAGYKLIKLFIEDQKVRSKMSFLFDNCKDSSCIKTVLSNTSIADNKVQKEFLCLLQTNKGLFLNNDVGGRAREYQSFLIWHNPDVVVRKKVLVPLLEQAFKKDNMPFEYLANQILRTMEIEGTFGPWENEKYFKLITELATKYNYKGDITGFNYYNF